MILRKLILENFRQFHGRGEITFAQPGDRNVTVILGQNGAGKTTLLNAFLWCFYQRLDVENPAEVLCHRTVQDAAIGDEIPLSVKTIFQDNGVSYTVKRRVVYQKLDGGAVEEVSPPDFRIDVMDANGQSSKAPDPKQLIQQILPERLTGFFFFRGEEMETLALQSSGPNLSKGVAEFLNFTLLDRAIRHLKRVGKDLEDELAKIAVGDMKRLTEEITDAEQDLADREARLENEEANIAELEKDRESIERDLAQAEETRPYLERKAELKQRKEVLVKTELDDRKRVAAIVSRDGYLAKATEILEIPLTLADAAVTAGELPAKIKPRFVDDLLEMGACICGRAIDDAARSKLASWRGKEGLAELEESVNQMRGSVLALAGRRERFQSDLENARTAWSLTTDDIARITEEISSIDSDLQGKEFGLEYVQGLQKRLRDVNDDLIERNAEVQSARDAVEAMETKLESLRSQRKRLSKDQSEAERIERQFDSTLKVIQTLENLKRGWMGIVQQYLDGQLKENWKRVAQLDRLVEFTPDFQLSIKERGPDGEWTVSAPSSANLRALALCFVSALIKLAAEIGEEGSGQSEPSKRQQPFEGGHYPLVMDAPFATMDKHFKQAVPSGLCRVVPQMTIIINFDQWSGEVEEVLSSSVGSAHILELHTPGGEENDLRIPYQGESYDYVVAEANAETDWSIIREVSL